MKFDKKNLILNLFHLINDGTQRTFIYTSVFKVYIITQIMYQVNNALVVFNFLEIFSLKKWATSVWVDLDKVGTVPYESYRGQQH